MKNYKLLIIAALFSFNANAQITKIEKTADYEKVGEVKYVSYIKVLKDSLNKTNHYLWMYENAKYRTITDVKGISFDATEEEFEGLYNIFRTQILEPKGTEMEMHIGKNDILIKTLGGIEGKGIRIFDLTGNGYINILSATYVDKLFGKK